MKNETVIVIPAYMQSQRLPGKPLLDVNGKSVLQMTYEAAIEADVGPVWVACDGRSWSLNDHCSDLNIPRKMIPQECKTGTERVGYFCGLMDIWDEYKTVVNLQCDEPTIQPEDIRALVENFSYWTVSTLVAPLDPKDQTNPNVVKAACGDSKCFFFTRNPMPNAMHHVGVYAFQPPHMLKSIASHRSVWSEVESLEQMAWLDYVDVRPVRIDAAPLAVNTQEDLEELRRRTLD